MKKTIIFYCHNFWWLWHNKRLSLIIKEIVNNFPYYDIVFLNSWENTDFLFEWFKNIKIINLPSFEIINSVLNYSHSNKKIWDLRKLLIKRILDKYNSEKLIIEHFPFWRNFLQNELEFLINYYKKINKDWNIIASLRDILDINSLNKKNLEYFDRFLVHSDENISNLEKFNLQNIKNKIIYTWYVVENFDFPIKKTKNIIINIWWWQDWFEYIIDFLNKFSKIKNSLDYNIIISLWWQYNEENIKIIKLFNLNLEIYKNINNLLEYKINSSLSVSMWWYNNLCEALKYWFKTIIYPRLSDQEQQIRLKIFKKIQGNIFSSEDDIEKILEKELDLENNKIDFNWAYLSASFIVNFKKYKYIKIRLTNSCNAKCDMCWVIKRKLDYNKIENIKKSIIDFYKLGWEVVNFTWWEPTIYKWFWNLLILSKELNLIISVSTNWSTLWEIFFNNLYFEWKRLIDYIDISIDWLYEKQDIRRNYKWLFKIISDNLKIIVDSWIFLHINITIRKDNIWEMIEIFDYLKNIWVNSISFGMIASDPLNDTSKLIPEWKDIEKFYLQDKEYIIKNTKNINLKFSPDFNWENMTEFIKYIQLKNSFPKQIWKKCNYINSKKEIRINENWNISPCCIIDDFDEWIGNINYENFIKIILSKKYETFLNKTFPHISKACLNCKIITDEW